MRMSRLNKITSSQTTVDTFKGYNHNLRIGDGEFYDMQNMTADYYPVASTRALREEFTPYGLQDGEWVTQFFSVGGRMGYIARMHDASGKAVKDQLRVPYEAANETVFVNLDVVPQKRNLITRGAYLVILPDKKVINTATFSQEGDAPVVKNIDAEFDTQEKVAYQFRLCDLDGTVYDITKMTASDKEPENPSNGQLWLDSTGNTSLKRWSKSSNSWESVVTNYVRLEATGIGIPFENGDGIHLTFTGSINEPDALKMIGNVTPLSTGYSMEADWVVEDKADNYIMIRGVVSYPDVRGDGLFKVTRKMPEMDFVIESGNRLWGCRYGKASNSTYTVNEIYASKLGDPTNWNCYQGISTDSYTVSLGSDAPFTGAINHLGTPVFFKENVVIEIQGAYPAQYRVQSIDCRGVQSGCADSLVSIENVLYYKAVGGVCRFDGSIPDEIGYPLGKVSYTEARSGTIGDKCYMNMKAKDDTWKLFVLDTEKGLWHVEDDIQVESFCYAENALIMLCVDGNAQLFYKITQGVTDGNKEQPFDWFVETGEIGIQLPEAKYVSKLNVRMLLEEGGTVTFYAMYDFEDEWVHICTIPSMRLQSIEIPIRPRRCDHMKLRIEGNGGAKIYSITKTIERGSGA